MALQCVISLRAPRDDSGTEVPGTPLPRSSHSMISATCGGHPPLRRFGTGPRGRFDFSLATWAVTNASSSSATTDCSCSERYEAVSIAVPSRSAKPPRSLRPLPLSCPSTSRSALTDSAPQSLVLGSLAGSPNYIDKAQVLTASYFDIGDAWDALSPAERTAANNYFLDQIAARGDRVLLSTPKLQIQSGTALSNEIQYLTQQQGYVWVNQWSLRPGG